MLQNRSTLSNDESKSRARFVRYIMCHARQLGLSDAQLARAMGTSRDRITKIQTVVPQLHVLQRLGMSVERFATGELDVHAPPQKIKKIPGRPRVQSL